MRLQFPSIASGALIVRKDWIVCKLSGLCAKFALEARDKLSFKVIVLVSL